MEDRVALKRELGRIYHEFQLTVGRIMAEREAAGEGVEPVTEEMLERMAAPLQSLIAAYGVDFDELVIELKKEMNCIEQQSQTAGD